MDSSWLANNWLHLLQKPWYQAGLLLVIALLLMLLIRPKQQEGLWVIAGLSYALFILLNAIMIVFSDSPWSYVLSSLLLSLLYLVAASTLVKLFTAQLQAGGSGESGMIFLIIIYHPLALALVKLGQWLYFKLF